MSKVQFLDVRREDEEAEKLIAPDVEMPMSLDILSNTYRTRKRTVVIDRPVFTEDDLTHLYCQNERTDEPSLLSRVGGKVKKCCSKSHLVKGLISLFPVISWLPKYNIKTDLVRDLACGLTLGIVQIPQGMAYGMLTTLPAIYGLYASLIPVFIYFLFGSSKHLNIGTFAIICLMVGEVVQSNTSSMLPLESRGSNSTVEAEQEEIVKMRVKVAVTVSFLVGILQVAFGFLRFGFITIFLSDPLISGFTTGAAFHVFSSQVKHLVGMSIPRSKTSGVFGLFKLYIFIFSNVKEINYGALIIGVMAAIILYVIKYLAQRYREKIKFPIPAELIVVILGTGLSYGFHFETKYNIPILSNVPTGMPPISIPMFSKMSGMVVDCLSIAIVSYAISVSVAKAFAKKNKYEIDANQELFAHGAVNIVGSFLSCFVASGSLSRSLIQENLGSTQFSALFSCVLIILTLTVLAPLVEPLPNAILAAIVLVALKGLFKQFSVLKDLIKISKIDAFVWVASFVAVFCLGVDYGLAVGLVVNLLTTVLRTSRPSTALKARVPNTEIYATINERNRYFLEELKGIKIFQFHAPLLYINVDHFQESLYKATASPADCVSIPVPKCHQNAGRLSLDDESEFFMEADDTQRHRSESHIALQSSHDPMNIKRSGSLDSPHRFRCTSVTVDSGKDSFCPLHTVILDCSQISYADTMGIGKLVSVCSEFKNINVDIHLCNTPSALLQLLDVGGFIEMHGSNNIFVSVHDAVQFSLTKQHTTGICNPSLLDVIKDSSYQLVSVDEAIDEEGECSSSGSSKESV